MPPYEDITKTGPQTYKELQEQNQAFLKEWKQTASPRQRQIGALEERRSEFRDPVEWAQELQQAGYGESKYDEYTSIYHPEELANTRGLQQSGWEQIANGVLKGAITTGTTYIDILAGIPVGIMTAAAEGRLSRIWDNFVTRGMQGVTDWAEEALPNYYTQEQRESAWYNPVNLFSANFLGDKLIKNFGFSAGAGLGMKTVSKLPKLLPKLVKDQTIARAINTAETAFAGAVGEGSIEALQGTREWANQNRALIEQQRLQEISELETYYNGLAQSALNEYGKEPELANSILNNLSVEYQEAVKRANQKADFKVSRLQDQIDTQGNLILAGNIPILMGSNIITLGKMIARGYNATEHSIGKYIRQTVKDGKQVLESTLTNPRQAARFLRTPIAEGLEEMNQAVVSTAAKNRATDYYNMSIDPDATESTKSFMGYIWDALGQTYGDIDRYEEFVIGMIASGISDIVVGQGKALREERRQVDDAVSRANDVVNNFNNTALLRYINRQQVLEDEKLRAAIENDKKDFKDAEFGQIASAVITFAEIGKIDELKAMIDYNLDNLSDEELNQLADSLSQTGIDGAEVNNFKLMSDKDKRDYLRKQKDTYHTVIDKYNKVREELIESTGNRFTPEQQSELIYYRLKADNAKERMDSIDKDIDQVILDYQVQVTPTIVRALGIEKEEGLPTTQELINGIKSFKGSNKRLAEIFKGTPIEQKFKDKARLNEDVLKYNTTVIDFIEHPEKLTEKNQKITNKVLTAEQKKKARAIANRINWKGNASDILRDYNRNKTEIDNIGEDTFLSSLADEERQALSRAQQDNKIDKSFHASIDDSSLFASHKRKIKDAYENSDLVVPEERIKQIKANIEEILKEHKADDVEYTKEERDTLEQQIEIALRTLSGFESEVADYREHIEKEETFKPPMEQTEPEEPMQAPEGDTFIPPVEDNDADIEDFEYNPSNVERYNRNSKKTRNHNEGTSNVELGRPQLTEFALAGIDNETYLDYISEYKEAIPSFTDDTTEEDYRTYIEAVHTYLKEHGAFDYVKHHLKAGDKLEFFIDDKLNEQAKQTVVLIRVAGTTQVIGSMPTDIDFNSRTKSVAEFNDNDEPVEWETNKQTLAERNPSRYKQYQDIVSKYNEDKKTNVDTTDKVYDTRNVEELKAGDISLSSREKTVKEVFDESNTQPIIGVVTIENNVSVIKYSREVKHFSLQGRQAGQVYTFIPSNLGVYVPTLLWSTPINEIISKGMDDPYIKDLVEQIQEFPNISRDERTAYVGKLQKSLRTPHGFTLKLVKYEGGKPITVNLIEEATEIQIQPNRGRKDEENTIKGDNSPIRMKLDENKELSDDTVLKAIKTLAGRFKGSQTMTTGVDIDRLGDSNYVNMISDYLNFNVNQAHTINDWFTYNLAIDKGKEIEEDVKKNQPANLQASRVEIREKEKVTILPNGEIIQQDSEEESLDTPPSPVIDTKDTSDNTVPKLEPEEEVKTEENITTQSSRGVFGGRKLQNTGQETTGSPNTRDSDSKFFTSEEVEEPVSETYLYQDIERLKKLLPGMYSADRVILTDNMIDSIDKEGNPIQVYAKYSNGILYIKRESPRGTAYHESFHYVADWLLSKHDKKVMLNEALARYNTTDAEEAEEKLAEDFRKFMVGMTDKTLRGRLRRIFIRLKALIDRAFNNIDGIDILFWDIYSNRFNKRIQGNNLYDNKLKAYTDKKYAYENLDEDAKEYMQERGFSRENYEKLSSKQKEYLLHCM